MNIITARYSHLVKIGLVALACAATVTACSSSGPSQSSGGSSDTSASATSDSDIVIGNIGTYSGVNDGPFAGGDGVMKAWASWTNAHGGIDGRHVTVQVMNDAGSASTALTDAKKLVQKYHVAAIVGEESGVAASWAKYVDQAGVPVVGGNSSDPLFENDPNFYAAGATLSGMYLGLAKAASVSDLKAGFVYCTEAPVCAGQIPFIKTATKQVSGTFVSAQPIAVTSPTFTAQCLAAKSAGVNVMFTGMPPQTNVSIAKSCATQQYYPVFPLDGTSNTLPVAEQLTAIPHARFVFSANEMPFFVTSTPATKAFHDALAKYAPSVLNKKMFTQNDMGAWVAGQLLSAAIKASGDASSGGIEAGLYKLHDETLGGLAPPLNYKKGTTNSIHCIFTFNASPNGYSAAGATQPKYC